MLSEAQRISLNGRLWPAACKFQGWNPKDRARLYEIYAGVLGHHKDHARTLAAGGRISGNDFVKNSKRDDFGEVKKELLNLAGLMAAPDDDPVRRSKMWLIEKELIPCFLVYLPEESLQTILRARFKRFQGINTLEDLSLKELDQVIMTIQDRADVLRAKAGHSGHDMRMLAKVKCACKFCWEAALRLELNEELIRENEPF